jgi:hypothetical protein
MSDLLTFARESPWWTLIYLCVISGGVASIGRRA